MNANPTEDGRTERLPWLSAAGLGKVPPGIRLAGKVKPTRWDRFYGGLSGVFVALLPGTQGEQSQGQGQVAAGADLLLHFRWLVRVCLLN